MSACGQASFTQVEFTNNVGKDASAASVWKRDCCGDPPNLGQSDSACFSSVRDQRLFRS